MRNVFAIAALGVLLGASPLGAARAQSQAAAAPATQTETEPARPQSQPMPATGPVTNLPLPRFVSIKTSRAFARRGPSETHRVDWIYERRDLPVRVTGEFEHWRRVEDSEGEGGWVHYSLLSGVRTVLVLTDMASLRSRPRGDAPQVAYLEAGVVARIMECDPDWCRVSIDGTRGWISRADVWGLEPGEVLD
ncbi:SH3 domain-containing protein [Rhodobacter sp. NTK016B]|uniref:SH3 domain-containing protein n=1 Tax=Rhodobacter sp. NTK016B TaxID=2759676 RepID=UPI002570C9C1|nr:SH3 domain-containing protein [Rhodobacter sp. NTK016B]